MYGNQETILTSDEGTKPGDHLIIDPHRRPKPAPRALSPIQPPIVPRTEMGPPPVVPRTETGGPPPVGPRTETGGPPPVGPRTETGVCVNSELNSFQQTPQSHILVTQHCVIY